MRILLLALVAVPAFANSVSREAQVILALNPNDIRSGAAVVHVRDVVDSCVAGRSNVRFFAIAEPQHCSRNQLVQFIGDSRVVVNVNRGNLRRNGLRINETAINCIQVVRNNKNKVIRRRVLRRRRLFGALVGRNARTVQVEVDACR